MKRNIINLTEAATFTIMSILNLQSKNDVISVVRRRRI